MHAKIHERLSLSPHSVLTQKASLELLLHACAETQDEFDNLRARQDLPGLGLECRS